MLELGLRHDKMAEWLAVDDDLPIYHAHKLQQIGSHRGEVIAVLPESELAQKEFGRLLLTHLTEHHGDRYTADGHRLSTRDGRLKWQLPATDLQAAASGFKRTSVCSGTEQRVRPDCGQCCSQATGDYLRKSARRSARSMIRCPAMGYLARKTNRLLHRLSKDKVIIRYNWSVQAGNELCC